MSRTTTREIPATAKVEDDFGDRASLWMENNSKLINGLLLVVVLLALGWTAYRWYRQGTLEKANQAYGQILHQFNTAMGEQDETKRRDALNGAITAAETVIREYPNQEVARKAQLLLGNAHYKLAAIQTGEPGRQAMKNARDAYEKAISVAQDPVERAAGQLALGNVLQDEMFINNEPAMAKQVEDAYKRAIDEAKGTFLEPESKMNLARLYEGRGQIDQAKTIYQSVVAEHKVEPKMETANVKAIELDENRTLTAEQIQELKSFARMSYAEAAQTALKRLAATSAAPAEQARSRPQ